MRKWTIAAAAIAAAAATGAAAKKGVGPYVNTQFEQGYMSKTWDSQGIRIEVYSGYYHSGDDSWRQSTLAFQAVNQTGRPVCMALYFDPFGNELNWAGQWGNAAVFYLKPNQRIENFAGINAYRGNSQFGYNRAVAHRWEPLGKRKCGPDPRGGPAWEEIREFK